MAKPVENKLWELASPGAGGTPLSDVVCTVPGWPQG